MITFWEVIYSIFFGTIMGGSLVFGIKNIMRNYKEAQAIFWTPIKYWIVFVLTMILSTLFALFGWFY